MTKHISTYTWKNSYKYTGAHKYGYWHGQGTLIYLDGEKYSGEWKHGKMHG